MKTRHILIVISFLVLNIYGYAQEFQIKGIVTEYGLPLPGVSVKNLKSKEKVETNFDGEYGILVRVGDTLKFSFSEKIENCFEVKYHTISNGENINVELLSNESLKDQLCKNIAKEFYIFIGKRIGSEWDNSYDECYINMNTNIFADFEVVEQFYGDLNMNTIKFKASDHASIEPFPFLNRRFSLLFIVKSCNEYYLWESKEILKTKVGDWALTYHPDNYSRFKNESIQLQAIPFKKKVKFKGTVQTNERYSEFFEEPYYEQKSKYLKPLMGNYVKDYVKLWMENTNRFKNLNAKKD